MFEYLFDIVVNIFRLWQITCDISVNNSYVLAQGVLVFVSVFLCNFLKLSCALIVYVVLIFAKLFYIETLLDNSLIEFIGVRNKTFCC